MFTNYTLDKVGIGDAFARITDNRELVITYR